MRCRYCGADAVYQLRADGETHETCREHVINAVEYYRAGCRRVRRRGGHAPEDVVVMAWLRQLTRVDHVANLVQWWRERRAEREWIKRDVHQAKHRARFRCPHDDYLCDKYGCPDDPGWRGDR